MTSTLLQKRTLVLGVLGALVLWLGPRLIPAYEVLPETVLLPKELTHEQALQGCKKNAARLPSLVEVIRLEHSGALVHRRTDFWSTATVLSYAFGWSTRKNMLSFDSQQDHDSVICIVDPL